MHRPVTLPRRDFLAAAAAAGSAAMLPALGGANHAVAAERPKLPVAAVVTVWFPKSHTDVLIGKILEGWLHDGGVGPSLTLASMYVDQHPRDDLSRAKAAQHGFRLARTIDEAITLGTDRVQVAGVISIGEHGDYPFTRDTQQQKYPRRRFFEEIAAAFRRGGKTAPVFNDKHLAYRWSDAKYLYDTARQRKIPLLAGSSVPLAWRHPALELDRGDVLDEAVTVGYDGLEIYGIHALEAHLAMIERRRGGEAGVAAVEVLQGDAIHRAAAQGRWSVELFEAAIATWPGNVKATRDWTKQRDAAVFLLEHRDGLKSSVVMVGELAPEFAFAGRVNGRREPRAAWIRLQNKPPFGHFAQQLRAIEETIHTGQPAYTAERTLLSTGILDRVMRSVAAGGKRFETPELAIAYETTDWPFANHRQTRLKLPDPS